METGANTVLVVDDEPSLRLLCRVNQELEGFNVLEAGTLEAARELLETEEIAVIVLDVHIGGGDGRDLMDELRTADSPVKILMLTLRGRRRGDAEAVRPARADPGDPAAHERPSGRFAGMSRRLDGGDQGAEVPALPVPKRV